MVRWYGNICQGSRNTGDVYLRRLGTVCKALDTTPAALAATDEKTLHGLLLDFVSSEQQRGRSGSYIHSSVKTVRSWLAHKGVRVTRPVRILGASATPTLADEVVPTQEQLARILRAATLRDRVACVLMAHSELRPEVLGNYLGDDGLRIGKGEVSMTTPWKRALAWFTPYQADFNRHYHLRSNVETAFSAIKRKFGEELLSKGDTAQRNELLAKIVIYNLSMVVRAMREHGVDASSLGPPAPSIEVELERGTGWRARYD